MAKALVQTSWDGPYTVVAVIAVTLGPLWCVHRTYHDGWSGLQCKVPLVSDGQALSLLHQVIWINAFDTSFAFLHDNQPLAKPGEYNRMCS